MQNPTFGAHEIIYTVCVYKTIYKKFQMNGTVAASVTAN